MYCFPPAGGQSTAFRPLANQLADEWDVWGIDPPGHGCSHGDLFEDMESILDFYLRHLQYCFTGRFYLLGHSLGGLVAFLVGRRLEALGVPPEAVIICATTAPNLVGLYPRLSRLHDEELARRVIELNADLDFANYGEVVHAFLPVVRADFRILESCMDLDLFSSLTASSLLAFGGKDDTIVPPSRVVEWRNYSPRCQIRIVQGDHFFLRSNPEFVANYL